MKMRHASALALALLMAGCLPRVINARVHDLDSLATQANTRHKESCTPPPPGAVRVKPAVCEPLSECAKHSDEASQACDALQKQLAKTGEGDDSECKSKYGVAVAACAVVGLKPMEVPRGR